MKMLRDLMSFCAVILLVSLVAGCSISNSIESSSDSFSNSSGSSSGSSSPDDDDDDKDDDDEAAPADTSYQDDVADYTSAYVAGLKSAAAAAGAESSADEAVASLQTVPGLDVSAFSKGISEVAAEYGITNWEGDSQTYAGIGAGLAKAGVSAEELPAYSQALASGDAAKAAAIEQGYGAGS
jgi:hypothetical protein